jgi:Holliday junction DNA helicase RuvA
LIASLTGAVAEVSGGALVLDVGGVGYLVHAPASVLAGAVRGERARLLTHLVVREDSLSLYGFRSADQRDLFQILLGVTGVGPKLALAVLSALEPSGLRTAVAAGDVDALTAVPGVGRRGAQRMLLELRDRLDIVVDEAVVPGSALAEARAALSGLGYTAAELRGVVEGVAVPGASVEGMVRAALKQLAGREPFKEVSVPSAADSAAGRTDAGTT